MGNCRSKGMQFYQELLDLAKALAEQTDDYVAERERERSKLASELETKKRLGSVAPASSSGAPRAAPS